ncbi:hypothetical protein BGW36DRAFT_427562 [Talaromyces proteolyticus]|uniref:Uncharacterized protein n=1 Tax=Talaromyces proteolyticus TaxID=1131652 RepID=A0AAD4Q0G5_9EURO|nr:uncharacterized protein BGW36DRAFT_427562 [Talaromyces proteolyticus]KAH8697607.1 hypothetical protein BGW36DRAFT_427562 [Talaromyces proteolyticus]
MSRKTIFLIGAPSRQLHWDHVELLDAAVAPFHAAGGAVRSDAVRWRVLVGPEAHASSTHDTVFLDTLDLQSKAPGDVLSRFYQHSISIRDTHYLSDSSHDETTLSLHDSYEDASVDPAFSCSTDTHLAFLGKICHLKDIPNAAYLLSIVPQTLSVTLVVAILGINPPRRVTSRYSNQQFDILELVVGDETKTGFGVTFWLPVNDTHKRKITESNETFASTLHGLRSRDIILLRNAGLSFFQDRVYGQSLRKDMTKVDLLHRQPLDVTDSGGIWSATRILSAEKEDKLRYKVKQVRDWMVNFVGVKAQAGNSRVGGILPPDTQ